MYNVLAMDLLAMDLQHGKEVGDSQQQSFLKAGEAGILSIFITSFSKWHAESKIAEKVRETHVA